MVSPDLHALPLARFLVSWSMACQFFGSVFAALLGIWGMGQMTPTNAHKKIGFWVLFVAAIGLAGWGCTENAKQLQQADLDKRTADAQYGDIKRDLDKLALAANIKGDQSPAEIVKEAISLFPKAAAIDITSGTGNLSGNANTSSIGQSGGQTIGSGNQGIITSQQNGNNTLTQNPQRHLTEKQIDKIKAAARGVCTEHKKISVTAANSNNEAQIYAGDFIKGLNKAGCDANLELPIPGLEATAMNVIIGVRPWPTSLDDLKANNPDAYSLQAALFAAHVKPELAPLGPNFFSGSKFILAIGGKEPTSVTR